MHGISKHRPQGTQGTVSIHPTDGRRAKNKCIHHQKNNMCMKRKEKCCCVSQCVDYVEWRRIIIPDGYVLTKNVKLDQKFLTNSKSKKEYSLPSNMEFYSKEDFVKVKKECGTGIFSHDHGQGVILEVKHDDYGGYSSLVFRIGYQDNSEEELKCKSLKDGVKKEKLLIIKDNTN